MPQFIHGSKDDRILINLRGVWKLKTHISEHNNCKSTYMAWKTIQQE